MDHVTPRKTPFQTVTEAVSLNCMMRAFDQLSWEHIANSDFRNPQVKEAKQVEFLVYGSFPWTLVRTIGVISEKIAERVREIVSFSDHQPDVQVQTRWYY